MLARALLLLPLLPAMAFAERGRGRGETSRLWACLNRTSQVELSNLPCSKAKGETLLVVGKFNNTINQTGWSQLEISGSIGEGVWDEALAYAAGAVEGRLTSELIYWHWLNTVDGYCEGVEDYCKRLENFLSRNWAWMVGEIKSKPKDPYWRHVSLLLHQFTGLVDGYYQSVAAPHLKVDVKGFLMFQLAGDLESIEQALHKPAWKLRKVTGSGSCSALVKVVRDSKGAAKDILFAHDTWSTYQSMLRILKLYRLPFKTQTAGATISFSGYPGTLSSIDDFYLASSGLAVTETTIGNNNASLWSHVRPVGGVLTWIRATVANRLASSTQQWAQIFRKKTSGTYNNQWMVLDYKRFSPGQPLPDDGLFLVLEQIPGLVVAEDQTKHLHETSFWPSYNVPFYPSVFNLSGNWANVAKYGDWFTYDKTPRALIFKRDEGSVVDMASLTRLMRSNNYTKDPLSRCDKCEPPYSAENAISARCDLNPINGSYPFPSLGHRSHGGIDMKATSFSLFQSLSMVAVSGPTAESLPPFVWSLADFPGQTPHHAHPDRWNFSPQTIAWESI